MFEARLDAKQCVCCGICADLCGPRALRLREWRSRSVEGPRLTLSGLASSRNVERAPVLAGTYPYLADPARCDGCMACVRECPLSVLTIQRVADRTHAGSFA